MNDKNYEDIINLPHYEPKYHKRMSISNRAAQFAPFSALTGYEDEIKETSRITYEKIELDDDLKEVLNDKLVKINNIIKDKPLVEITYFIKDSKKLGGTYKSKTLNIKKIDFVNMKLKFADNSTINIDDIININKID